MRVDGTSSRARGTLRPDPTCERGAKVCCETLVGDMRVLMALEDVTKRNGLLESGV